MTITSEIIGSLNTPGYGFLNDSLTTYSLPKFPNGVAILLTRWVASGEMSFDILDGETGKVVDGTSTTGYARSKNMPSGAARNALAKGALLRFNTSTPLYAYIIPNGEQAPPVWNGQ